MTDRKTPLVRAWEETVVIPTYEVEPPDRNPMFLEKRVYQGSSGKVYPLPFTDRVATAKTDHRWRAVFLENRYLRVMILPEIGGRVHEARDKTNGYDFIYRQSVIKPALVGLAGPWISGGIEFNWPQHHRPATFLPVDYRIETQPDGSATVWCGDHDPRSRMKGLHGICLHPDRAVIELKARVYNRTPFVQTFLWWANIAVRAHAAYQSFFPPDVHCVADHAKRATSEYPRCSGRYYGVDYGPRARQGVPMAERPAQFLPPHSGGRAPVDYPPNDLSWYANIPTPCSYMALGTEQDFFGGYDHFHQAGLVHVASHHISPGKKQWTWGNQEFGYAWDRNLTDADGPYIELMAGVYTDNQPDFSFLQPGETKTWSQYLYPIQQIGPAHHANVEAAISLGRKPDERKRLRLGISVTARFSGARVQLSAKGRLVFNRRVDLLPGRSLMKSMPWPKGTRDTDLKLAVLAADGREIISYSPAPRKKIEVPAPATEPPSPGDIASVDELYLTGLHLEQYRHATRCPTLYWREALRRDPLDARCHNAVGLWHLRRGEFDDAERHFRKAIERLTRRNPNPNDGEAYYNLGLCLRHRLDSAPDTEDNRGLFDEAYAAFYKATWNQGWAAAGYHALAEMDCRRGAWSVALAHLDRSLRSNPDNGRARNLKAMVLRKLNRKPEVRALLTEALSNDPLDFWARHLAEGRVGCDNQVRLDIAHDLARAGLYAEAVKVLRQATMAISRRLDQNHGTLPMIHYTLGWMHERLGDSDSAALAREKAAAASPDYCFPARLEDIAVLESAIRADGRDARAPYYLGNLLYDRRRYREAIEMWRRSARLNPDFSIVWRNLGIGFFNVAKQPAKARQAYERAVAANPRDARLLYERDQLWKRLGAAPQRRLRELEGRLDLVRQRDDLSLELCALYNQTGRHEAAMTLISSRQFQPWEGGEGQALGQYVRTCLALGRAALRLGKADAAEQHFAAALTSPPNLGEARHLLANCSDIHYWLGRALEAQGRINQAREHWRTAASFKGDFQEMSIRSFSEMTYYSALAWECLGRRTQARRLLRQLRDYALELQKAPAKIDYFATSLPALLLFEDDLQFRQTTTALFLRSQAELALGRRAAARALLRGVLNRDPNHALAFDLLENL